MYGNVFSREYLDQEEVQPVPLHLISWLKKDIKETIEEEIPKAEKSIKRIEVELKTSEAKLAKLKVGTPDYAVVLKEFEFLKTMLGANQARLTFYDGKIYLLKKRLAISK